MAHSASSSADAEMVKRKRNLGTRVGMSKEIIGLNKGIRENNPSKKKQLVEKLLIYWLLEACKKGNRVK